MPLDDCREFCMDINGRVSALESTQKALESNQRDLSEALKQVVTDLRAIILELGTRKAVERFALVTFGGFMSLAGWIVHLLVK